MQLNFPDSSHIYAYLDEKNTNTKDHTYLKEMGILAAAAKVFENQTCRSEEIKLRVGRLLHEKKCFMPYEWLLRTHDLLSSALQDCAIFYRDLKSE